MLDFQYQVANAGTITDANTPTTGWIDENLLDFTSPALGAAAGGIDGNAGANRIVLPSTNIAVTINAGQEIWLRWQDINDAGNDHGLAIDDFSVTANGIILAIKLHSIAAENKGRINLINWTNASEDAGDKMEVQSSLDGINFKTIATIQAKGVNNTAYNYEDNYPVNGINYYRLKMIDLTGLKTYSKTVTAVVKEHNNIMTIYPNPAHNSIKVLVESEGELKILNMEGQVVKIIKAQAGNNYIDIASLPLGVYQVKYSNNGTLEWSRFIKN